MESGELLTPLVSTFDPSGTFSPDVCFRPIADIRQTQQTSRMTSTGYDALIHVACVEWGFCGCIKHEQRLHVDLFIPTEGPITADQFVEWLFLADNVNPNLDPLRWQRQKAGLRAAFIKHMGAEVVDAVSLRWSDVPTQDESPDLKFRGNLPDED